MLQNFGSNLDLSNSQCDYKMQQEMTHLIHGYLGKGNCKQLPQCVLHNAFPDDPTKEYVGFKIMAEWVNGEPTHIIRPTRYF